MSSLNAPLAATPSAAVTCAHCGDRVPTGLIAADNQPSYCCNGCRTVAEILRANGLGNYYELREKFNARVAPVPTTGQRYEALDHEDYHKLHVRQRGSALETELTVDGVHCAACVWLIENLGRVLNDVSARVNLSRGIVTVRWDGKTPLSQIARTLDNLGYPTRTHVQSQTDTSADRRLLVHLAVAAVCAGNAMLLAFALYSGLFDAIQAEYVSLFRWCSMGFGLIALLGPGQVFLRNAWAALRTATPHLDVPVALGLLAAGIAGVVNTVRGQGEIFFDSLTLLVFLLLVGRWIQHHQQRWIARALDLLVAVTPRTALRFEGDAFRAVPVEALQPGDRIQVQTGNVCPTDGSVLKGESDLDLSLLTGEAVPVPIGPDGAILAGATNLTGPLEISVARTGYQTRLGQLLQMVEELRSQPSNWVRRADSLAKFFVAAVLLLAGLTTLLWWTSGAAIALNHAVALVVVVCPCALSLATPLTVGMAIARAARRDLFIKGGDVLERLSTPGTLLFDKTGTLTTGKPRLVDWHGQDNLRTAIVAVEQQANHPLAKAWVSAWREHDQGLPVIDFRQHSGGGVSGIVGGQQLVIGNARFVASETGVEVPPVPDEVETIAHVACDGAYQGYARFCDALRPEAPAIIRSLQQVGWRVGVASGDRQPVVAAVAQQVGIAPEHTWGELSPEDKLQLVQDEHVAPVVMVGDGINDAAALAAAGVGIAVRGGAEASLVAADVYLRKDGLQPLHELLVGAKRTDRAIRLGLGMSLCYNVGAVGLAIAGQLTALTAAILMPLSSLTVLAIAAGAPTFQWTKGEEA